jgi:hypothetical protein
MKKLRADCVADFASAGRMIAPAIQPRDSFEFVPAAAGVLRIEVLSAPGLRLATQPIVVR